MQENQPADPPSTHDDLMKLVKRLDSDFEPYDKRS